MDDQRTEAPPSCGHLHGGLPFNRFGAGPRVLVYFQGITFAHEPMTGFMTRFMRDFCRDLLDDYTVYVVNRRPGLARGSTMADIARDYADMIRHEFGGPVDIMGISTGGSAALAFAAGHPELARRLVVHSAAHTLGPDGRRFQSAAARCAGRGDWPGAARWIMEWMKPRRGAGRLFMAPVAMIASRMMAATAPPDPGDFIATIEAEDAFSLRERLCDITAPTLVIAGARDPGYTPDLFAETAAGIPGARLALFPTQGHPAQGRDFRRALTAFLEEGRP